MLDKEFTKKWITALKSGEYQQGVGQLCDGEPTYCCLGVACKIVDPDVFSKRGKNYGYFSELYEGSLIGLDDQLESKLIMMNDDEFKTFVEIADYLETLINTGETNASV